MLQLANDNQMTKTDSHGFQLPLLDAVTGMLRSIWRRKALMVAGILLGLGLGAAYYYLRPPAYASHAEMMVVRKRPRSLPMPGVDPQLSYFEDSLGSHQALIQSPLNIRRAIRDSDLASLSSLGSGKKTEAEVVARIAKGLRVSRDGGSMADNHNAIFFVSYEGTNSEECETVLDAVIAAYDDFLNETHRSDSDDMRTLYVHWRDDIRRQVTERKGEYNKMLGRIKPHHWTAEGGVNLSERRVAEIVAQRLGHLVHLAEVSERIRSLEEAKAAGINNQVLIETISKWVDSPIKDINFDNQLFQLLLEEQGLLKKYGKNHPEVISIRHRIQITARQALGSGADIDDIRLMDPVEVVIQALKQDRVITQNMERSLVKLIDQEHAKAKEAHEANEVRQQLRADLTSMETLQIEVVKQLQELDVVKRSAVLETHLLSPPAAGKLVKRKQPATIFATSLLAGLLIGGSFVTIRECRSASFQNPQQIQDRLKLPVWGHIPYRKVGLRNARRAKRSQFDVSLVTHYEPHGVDAEAYRGTCNTLYFNARAKRAKIIQISSPRAGDGKSTIASNLALSIAASGRRVVLVDADFRKPNLHNLFGLSADVGFASVLAGDTPLAEVVTDVGVSGLRVLPCGAAPSNPVELVNSPEFKNVLDELAKQFDYVLVDSSPLLAVTDAVVVAAHTDAVLLALRNSEQAGAIADQAIELLHSVNASILGLIVNGTKECRGQGGFGYGQPRPQYGYLTYGEGPTSQAPSAPVVGPVSDLNLGDVNSPQT